MRDLSTTESFVVLMAGARKSLGRVFSIRLAGAVIAAALFDLEKSGVIDFSGEQETIAVHKELPTELATLKVLVDYLKSHPKATAKQAIRIFTAFSLSVRCGHLVDDVVEQLAADNLGQIQPRDFLKIHRKFLPAPGVVEVLTDSMKAELSESTVPNIDDVALAALLKGSKLDHYYLSQFDLKHLEARLQAVQNTPEGQRIVRLCNHAEFALKMMMALFPF